MDGKNLCECFQCMIYDRDGVYKFGRVIADKQQRYLRMNKNFEKIEKLS